MEHYLYLSIERCKGPVKNWFGVKDGGKIGPGYGPERNPEYLWRNAGWEESFLPPEGMYNAYAISGELVS